MSSTTTRTPTGTSTRSVRLPSAAVFIGTVYAVCVLGLLAWFVGEIVFTDTDPYKSEGAVEAIVAISIASSVAIAIGLAIGLSTVRTPERAAVGAVILGALSVLSLPFFWSGAPGVLGAFAAWLGGLTRGSRPQGGAARVAGIVGAFVAVLNVVLTVGSLLLYTVTN